MCRRFAFLDFLSLLTCLELLTIPELTIADLPRECTLPSYKGPCQADYIRYFFNFKSLECETFVYGGCMGNGNTFDSLEDCEKICNVSGEPLISMPKHPSVISATVAEPLFSMQKPPSVISATVKEPLISLPKPQSVVSAIVEEPLISLLKPQSVISPTVKEPLISLPKPQSVVSAIVEEPLFSLLKPPNVISPTVKALPTVCTLPPDKGPCQQHHPRYYYNLKKNKCAKFSYGGCLGNRNKFIMADACRKMCKLPSGVRKPLLEHEIKHISDASELSAPLLQKPNTPKKLTAALSAICSLPPDKGPCQQHHHRYYYNLKKNKCAKFIYGGCLGNGNKFITANSCTKMCKLTSEPSAPLLQKPNTPKKTTAACTLPSERGPCKEIYVFYYYNIKKKRCETFIYGGCFGNDNKFPTDDVCQEICGASTELSTPSLMHPTALDVTPAALPVACTLPSQKGPCHEDSTRYYYNVKSQSCETFLYGGCLGNENNFFTEESCKQMCKVSTGFPPSSSAGQRTTSLSVDQNSLPILCTLSPEKGNCHGHHTRYFYNMKSNNCEMFIYGGCLGNGNRFYNIQECLKRCKKTKDIPIICQISKDSGTCSKRLIRYYYNKATGRCETFKYSGCGGNANHFHSMEECQNICSV